MKIILYLKVKGREIKLYLNEIRPYLKDINNLKKSDTWEIQFTTANNKYSSIDNDE